MRGADERAVLRRRAGDGAERDVADLGVDVELLVVARQLLSDVDVQCAGLGSDEVVADLDDARHARHVEHGAADIRRARRRRMQLADRTHGRGVRRRIRHNAHDIVDGARPHDDSGAIGDAAFPVGDLVGRGRKGQPLRAATNAQASQASTAPRRAAPAPCEAIRTSYAAPRPLRLRRRSIGWSQRSLPTDRLPTGAGRHT